jgi:hypothetical protein
MVVTRPAMMEAGIARKEPLNAPASSLVPGAIFAKALRLVFLQPEAIAPSFVVAIAARLLNCQVEGVQTVG